MSDSTNVESATTITYGDFTFDLTKLPQSSVVALASSGLAHKLGNECSAKVSAENKRRKAAEANVMTEAEADAYLAEAVKAMVKKIEDGTVGTTVRGPKLSPIERLVRDKAVAVVTKRLTDAGLAVPKGKETVKIGSDELTMADLIARRLTAEGDKFRKEAEAEMKAIEREAAKAKAAAEASGATGAAALGL